MIKFEEEAKKATLFISRSSKANPKLKELVREDVKSLKQDSFIINSYSLIIKRNIKVEYMDYFLEKKLMSNDFFFELFREYLTRSDRFYLILQGYINYFDIFKKYQQLHLEHLLCKRLKSLKNNSNKFDFINALQNEKIYNIFKSNHKRMLNNFIKENAEYREICKQKKIVNF